MTASLYRVLQDRTESRLAGKDPGVFTHIEVEANDNCPMTVNMVYKNLNDPVQVSRLRLYDGAPGGSINAVTGWSSADGGSPVPAYAVQVEDSGLGAAFVVYGADWGLRLRPEASAAEWDLHDPEQWGETHLVLADAEDILSVDEP